jgi:type II secretory pathway pseudopilin PulG
MNQAFESHSNRSQSAMALIELLVVIGLMAVTFSIMIPQFNARTGTEAANRVQRLADSIRSAYDMAVLNQKTYRLVFELGSGKYYLQVATREFISDTGKVIKDPSEEEDKGIKEAFKEKTEEYKNMAGELTKDEDGEEIPGSNLSPILKNRDRAAPVEWETVDGLEWTNLSLGDFLILSEMQAEHHGQKQLMNELGPSGRVFIYAFPEGRVEKAYFRVSYRGDGFSVDDTQPPYTLVTNPFTGSVQVLSGVVEIDVDQIGEGNNE